MTGQCLTSKGILAANEGVSLVTKGILGIVRFPELIIDVISIVDKYPDVIVITEKKENIDIEPSISDEVIVIVEKKGIRE